MNISDFSATDVDLGAGHYLRFFDCEAAAVNTTVARGGARLWHYAPDGSECAFDLFFDIPGVVAPVRWYVVAWEPLTLTPGVFCPTCGDRGTIQDGRWVAAPPELPG